MSYDKEFIAVQAGKTVEIIFDNVDLMPHNLVIGQPGSLEELGIQAEATATDADAHIALGQRRGPGCSNRYDPLRLR